MDRRFFPLLGLALVLASFPSEAALAQAPTQPGPAARAGGPASTSLASGTWTGLASWYGEAFQGRRTANGEIYDRDGFTAAHRSLPFGSLLLVRSLDTGASVVVRINDRGPLVEGRVLDLSEAAARVLGLLGTGLAQVSFTLIAPEEAASFGSPRPSGPGPGFASKSGPESAPSPTSEPSAGPATGLAAGLAAGRSGGGGAAAVSTQPRAKERLCRIQVAAYKDARNAEATVRRLSLAGLEASLEVAGQFRRVVFPAVAAAEAERLAERLRSLGYRDLLIVWY